MSTVDDLSGIWIQSSDMMWVMRTYAGPGQIAVHIMNGSDTTGVMQGARGCVAVPTWRPRDVVITTKIPLSLAISFSGFQLRTM